MVENTKLFHHVAGINSKTGRSVMYGRVSKRRSSENFRHARMAILCGLGGAESLRKIKSFEVTDRIRTLRALFKRLNNI